MSSTQPQQQPARTSSITRRGANGAANANGGTNRSSPNRARSPTDRAEVWKRLQSPPPDHQRSVSPKLCEGARKLTKEDEVRSLQRLSDEYWIKHNSMITTLERKFYGDPNGERQTLDKETSEAVVFRMYQQGVEDKRQKLQSMRNSYISKYKVQYKRFENKGEEAASIHRLMHETMEKGNAKLNELDGKYNPKRQYLKRSQQEMESIADRYYKGGFARKEGGA